MPRGLWTWARALMTLPEIAAADTAWAIEQKGRPMKGLGVGRIVHVTGWPEDGEEARCYAAIVTSVLDPEAGVVDLFVLRRGGYRLLQEVPYADTPTDDHWHWAEVV